MNPLLKATSEVAQAMIDAPPPTHLLHQPIYMMPYGPFDGRYAGGSDCKYLDVGIAQYRGDGETPISIKSWRKPDEKWSRQSEEIPAHRLVDMAILTALVMAGDGAELVELPAGTFTGQTKSLTMQRLMDPSGTEFASDQEQTIERLRKLRDVLNALPI